MKRRVVVCFCVCLCVLVRARAFAHLCNEVSCGGELQTALNLIDESAFFSLDRNIGGSHLTRAGIKGPLKLEGSQEHQEW